MNRILILGSGGSGKSTLSQRLSNILNLPVVHLDRYFWKANWVPTPNEEWDQIVENFTTEKEWIIDGNYSRTMDTRIKHADLIIYLDMSKWLCLYRVLKRRVMYHKKTRPDMNEACQEKLDWEFFKWIWNYRKRSRMKTITKLEQIKNEKQIIILKNRKEVRELINKLESTKGF
ncbi:DNA topology modulation protein [Paenibacillus sp. HB172176]|uniref:DNA topology modulation protein n=1 Tax=Paenibacillus sp. HB172176 TaxID=2493690 RepID=UPI00143A7180|nr:DNA topology modulation protein [Paenibacillus sp. HB172176]